MSSAATRRDAAAVAAEMAALPLSERNMMIALGILSGVVIDARRIFSETVTIGPLMAETTLVFEGTYGPEDWDCG
jgi:hypothetical protein